MDGVELEADTEVADTLLGLNEGAAYIVVADEPEAEGDAGFFSVPQSCCHSGVGDGNDDVGGNSGFAG